MERKRLIIIDSNSVIHRAFHALPPLTTKKGELVNAVYGFLLVFFRAAREFQPDFIATCFDSPGPTFRHREFKEYKAKRPPTPKDLAFQIPKIKEILNAFNVPIFEKEGFEADDIIGTLVWRAAKFPKKENLETIIISGDSDVLQLVNSRTKVYSLRKGVKDTVLYDENMVREKYQGLNPAQLVDFKSLRGDPSDNIPGVAGIGEKTAIELIKKFGSLEKLYQNYEEAKPRLKDLLLQQKERAILSKKLVQIERDVPIKFDLKKCRWKKYDRTKITRTLRELEFQTLIARLPELKEGDKTTLEINRQPSKKDQLNLNF